MPINYRAWSVAAQEVQYIYVIRRCTIVSQEIAGFGSDEAPDEYSATLLS
jgi:hypothetical protein